LLLGPNGSGPAPVVYLFKFWEIMGERGKSCLGGDWTLSGGLDFTSQPPGFRDLWRDYLGRMNEVSFPPTWDEEEPE